jgi:hypothetical protein
MLETVTAPFAQATTRLKQKADGRVLDYWILHIGRHFVERILEVKNYQKKILFEQFFLLVIQTSCDQNYSY